MTPELKVLVDELEQAIHESVGDSDRIAAIVADVKRAGYDVTLVLEATIGFTVGEKSEESSNAEIEAVLEPVPLHASESTSEFGFTHDDQEFLKALKIGVGD
jgi:hypothetical protein